jgi:hypothetical protein
MPRPSSPPTEREQERAPSGAGPDPAQSQAKPVPARTKNDAALPGSQNADLKGAKRDRTLRGATT